MDDDPTPESKSLSPVVGFAAASALGAILILVLAHQFGLTTGNDIIRQVARLRPAPAVPARIPVTAAQLVPVVPPLPTSLPPTDAALAAMVAQGVTVLGLKPKTVILPNEQALDEVAAIKGGDYAAATHLV